MDSFSAESTNDVPRSEAAADGVKRTSRPSARSIQISSTNSTEPSSWMVKGSTCSHGTACTGSR